MKTMIVAYGGVVFIYRLLSYIKNEFLSIGKISVTFIKAVILYLNN
jgi:hypothetical protein